MKTAKYYLCPVEGFVSENDMHSFIYDCELIDDLLTVNVTNLNYLTDKPIYDKVVFNLKSSFSLILKGVEIDFNVIGCNDFQSFETEFNALNPDLIESLLHLTEIINKN